MKAKYLQFSLLIGLMAYAPFSHAIMFGNAPTKGVWDSLKTYITTQLLQSNFVIVLALLSVVGGIYQLAHGRGFTFLGTVVFVVMAAAVGPGFIDAAATAVASPALLDVQNMVSPWAASQPPVLSQLLAENL